MSHNISDMSTVIKVLSNSDQHLIKQWRHHTKLPWLRHDHHHQFDTSCIDPNQKSDALLLGGGGGGDL